MAQKGFRTLVDAVGILMREGMDRRLAILTFGWGGFIREDFQYVEERGLQNVFLQQPHTDEPERWMKGLDVIAMPSRWEACPLQPMEALAAGVPVVGTTCLGLREVLQGSPARMVTPGDAAGLAAALRDELETPRREQFEAYAPTAVERFAVDVCAERLRDLYRGIAATPAHGTMRRAAL
jgi:glycosyltransferase involved in cell wall biosynthesis